METLFKTCFGSYLYGTNTSSSDVDIKSIYMPSLDDLLLGKKLVNVVKNTNKVAFTKNSVDDVDEEFIPLHVFADGFLNGQTYALELAFAMNSMHCNQEFSNNSTKRVLFKTFMTDLTQNYLTSNIKAMVGYVVNQANIYSFKGERLNVALDFLEIIKPYKDSKDTLEVIFGSNEKSFKDLALKYPKYFKEDEHDIGGNRLKPCFKLLEKTLPFSIKGDNCFNIVSTIIKTYGDRAKQASETNVDWKAMMHAVRITEEALMLLTSQKLVFPLSKDYVDNLLKIKSGLVPLEEVKNLLNSKLEELKQLEMTTVLKPYSPELKNRLDKRVLQFVKDYYGLC